MDEYNKLKNKQKELEKSYSLGDGDPDQIIEEYNKTYKAIKALNRKQYYETSKERVSINIQDITS